jgi:hypothetical protein
MNKFTFCLLTLTLCAMTAHAEVYKWVDQDGKVQYSDQPPPPGASKANPQTLSGASTASAGAPADKSLKEKTKESDKRKTEVTEKQKKEETATKLAADNQERCSQARGNLNTLQSGRVARFDEKGERSFLDDQQLESEIAKTQKFLAESCK